jgi:hypothetical protein
VGQVRAVGGSTIVIGWGLGAAQLLVLVGLLAAESVAVLAAPDLGGALSRRD